MYLCFPLPSCDIASFPSIIHLRIVQQAIKTVRKGKDPSCYFMLAMQQEVARPGYSGRLLVSPAEHCSSGSKDASADLLYKS